MRHRIIGPVSFFFAINLSYIEAGFLLSGSKKVMDFKFQHNNQSPVKLLQTGALLMVLKTRENILVGECIFP